MVDIPPCVRKLDESELTYYTTLKESGGANGVVRIARWICDYEGRPFNVAVKVGSSNRLFVCCASAVPLCVAEN
jgi:hypothetical protein